MYYEELQFDKELPGADIVFQPDNIAEYRNDAWDVRISIEDAPLDEAFYFTIDDPNAARLTIQEILNKYVLNPALKDKLDIEDYPELPFLHEELIQYRDNESKGLLEIKYYINKNAEKGYVSLTERANKYLSTCIYHDQSLDYRVLDLILVPYVSEMVSIDMEIKVRNYGYVFLLLFLNYSLKMGDDYYYELMASIPIDAYLNGLPNNQYSRVKQGLQDLELNGFIKRSTGSIGADQLESQSFIEITDRGSQEIEHLLNESQELLTMYKYFESVSISPPALGVPEGFDVRVQMMEFDGLDYERSVLLRVLDDNKEEYYQLDHWYEVYEEFAFYCIVQDAMAYKTNFSAEVLEALKRLAEGNE